MADKSLKKYWRLKELNLMLIKIKENGEIVYYENTWLVYYCLLVFIVETGRHFYFAITPFEIVHSLFYGTVI